MNLLAQTNLGTLNGIGLLGQQRTSINATLVIFNSVLSTVIGVLTVAAGLWFMSQVFSGAFQWLTSGGDKQSLENARKRLTHAIIGLLMVVLSYALISIIGLIFGLPILNPENIIPNL